MKKLILVCGPAGIGKSTWSKKYAEEHPEEKVEVLAADDTRKELYGSYNAFPPNRNMMVVYRYMVQKAAKMVQENRDITIIFDTTMLYDELRLYFRRHLRQFNHYTLVLLKLKDYRKCLERNRQRIKEKWVPDQVILDMAKHYSDPSKATKKHFDECLEIYVD